MQGNDLVGLLNTIGDGFSSEIVEFRKLVNDFDGEVKEFEKKQDELTKYLQAYKIPSAEKLEVHKQSIDRLSEKYRRIYSLAKNITESDDIKEDDGIENFILAIANCRKLTLQAKVRETCKILERFCRIVSRGKDPDILKSYQQNAKSIMDQLSAAEGSEIESLIEKAAGPKAFMKAFDSNVEDDEYFELSEKVRDYFGPKIQFLLNSKKFEEKLVVNAENIAEKSALQISELKHKGPPGSIEKDTLVGELASVSVMDSVSVEHPVHVLDEEPVCKNLKRCYAMTASSMKRFMDNLQELCRDCRTQALILPAVSKLGILAERHIDKLAKIIDNRNFGELRLEHGAKLGFYAVYEFNEENGNVTKVCTLTPFCYDGYKKNKSSKLDNYFRIPFNQGGLNVGENLSEELANEYVKKNDVFFAYIDCLRNGMTEKELGRVVADTNRKKNSYAVPVFCDGVKSFAYLLLNAEDAATADYENVLVVADVMEIPQQIHESCKVVFVAKDGDIYKCCPKNDTIENQILEVDTRPEPAEIINTEIFSEPIDVATPEGRVETDASEEMPSPPKVDDSVYVAMDANRPHLETPTVQNLIDLRNKPYEDEFLYVAENLLKQSNGEDVVIQSMLLAETASFEKNCKKCGMLSKQIQLAIHLFLDDTLRYSDDVLSVMLLSAENLSAELKLAIYLQGMVTPSPRNFMFNNMVAECFKNYESEFAHFPKFKQLYSAMLRSMDACNVGFTKQILNAIGSGEVFERQIKQMRENARLSLIPSKSSIVTSHLPFTSECVNNPSYDMYRFVKQVENGDKDQETLDLMGLYLEDFCENDEISISKVENFLEMEWKRVYSDSIHSIGKKRKFLDIFHKRIKVIKDWIDCFGNNTDQPANLSERKETRDQIVGFIDELLFNKVWKKDGRGNVLELTLEYIKKYLTSSIPEKPMLTAFSELLKTGYISLDDSGKPILEQELTDIRFNEPWLYVLRHIVTKKKEFSAVCEDIRSYERKNYESQPFDNLHQLDLIGELLNKSVYDNDTTREESWIHAKECACRDMENFQKDLELRYTYGQFGESQREYLKNLAEDHERLFRERGDFAQWRWFLEGLNEQKNFFAVENGKTLKSLLETKINVIKDDSTLKIEPRVMFLEKAKAALHDRNYSLAEEYINRYDRNEDIEDYDEKQNLEKQYFEDFLSPLKFSELHNFCNNHSVDPVSKFGLEYLREHTTEDIQNDEESEALISNWWLNSQTDQLQVDKSRKLFNALGFTVQDVTENATTDNSMKRFSIKVEPEAKSLRRYKHPICNYGTGAHNLNVICISRILTPENLVSDVFDFCVKNNLNTINTVVLVDSALDLSYRRRISDLTHDKERSNNPFLVIDWILLLYLASLRRSDRIVAMLQCTLPFSAYQPFCDDNSTSGIGDEMFFGREEEISRLISDNPPCFVYGGRQLGKTTLLLRAANLCHNVTQTTKQVAVYVDIKNCKTEEKFIEKVVQNLNTKLKGCKIAMISGSCRKISTFKREVERHFEENRIQSLFLLLDESDNYLNSLGMESFDDDHFGALEDLVELKRSTHNMFRFVFAGLHNVSRAKNATKNNSVLGQFGQPLCVRPLRYRDASNLLVRPLRYVGFKIAQYPYLDSILASTNYYPGIIQFFGNMLIKETLIDKYAFRSDLQNPPFTLKIDHLRKVIASKDLIKSIQDKFVMSLQLDERYLMIANCITALYHINDITDIWMGFSIREIKDMADNILDIKILANVDAIQYENLLNEMVDMGILENSDEKYRLRRRSFIDAIGDRIEKIEQTVKEANENFEKGHG